MRRVYEFLGLPFVRTPELGVKYVPNRASGKALTKVGRLMQKLPHGREAALQLPGLGIAGSEEGRWRRACRRPCVRF